MKLIWYGQVGSELSNRFWQTDQKSRLMALTSGQGFDTLAPVGSWFVSFDESAEFGRRSFTIGAQQ